MALEQEPVAAPTPLAGQEEQDVEARPPTANEQPKESPEYSARKWSMAAKMWVSWSSIAAFFVVSIANSIYIGSITGVMEEFNIGFTLAISPVTFYSMGFAIGPMITSALSEEFGRAYIYKVSLLLTLVFTIVAGSAKNFATLAVARAISGLVASPCVSVFAGVLNDIWKMPEDKAAAPLFALYGLFSVLATEVGPISGVSIVDDHDWRWSFWLTAMLLGVCWLALLFVPETYAPEIHRRALRLPRSDWRRQLKVSFTRPLHMLFVEPVILPTAAIVTVGQIVIFAFYAAYPIILMEVYDFSNYSIGLAFLPLMVGSLFCLPILSIVQKRRIKHLPLQPEQLMPAAFASGVLMPVGLFWFAWTARSSIHWICPLLAGFPYGLGFALSQLIYPLYKNEIYGAELGASAFAIDVAMRYTCSCVFPLFTAQMIRAMRVEWAISLYAFVLTALIPVPLWLARFGPGLRARSRYVAVAREQRT
ncbi:hypothetical protein VTN49DRAFT_1023 [Thermomyces lanuginosus]|uniref:uncharacterized protein n=1 Tax=Thermomyces lanuginosus TaxID=5541 RepID=UPI0037447BBB